MTGNALQNIEQIESSLWEVTNQLRASSKLTPSAWQYRAPPTGNWSMHNETRVGSLSS
jgi:hypothetical protein